MKTFERSVAYPTNINRIEFGDRIYARLSCKGEKIAEFFIETASDISDIIRAMIGVVGRGMGLTRLYVRNFSQGWSREQSVLLR